MKHHVLLTKRSSNLRAFPRAWVLPGGKVEKGNRIIEDCLLREIEEEVGINIIKTSGEYHVEGTTV